MTKVGLPYGGGPAVNYGNPVVAVRAVADRRDDEPTYLGTIRGGFGNPLKTLETVQPVATLVAQAFSQALAQRGLLASPGAERYDLDLTLQHLDGNQMIFREAVTDFTLSVRDRKTGAVVYVDDVLIENQNGSAFSFETGIAGSISELHLLIVRTMNQAINQVLDKPGFLAIVTAPAA